MSIPLRNTANRYGLVSQLFHWLVVGLILFQYTWAWRIDNAEGFRLRLELVTQHKTIGMAVLCLAILRLIWRLFNRPPPLPANMSSWKVFAAKLGHALLYGLIFALPISGWLYSSAAGLGDFWWGPISFPSLVGSSELLEDRFGLLHQVLGVSLAVVAAVHLIAALRHHFVLKDSVLKRMLPIWPKNDS